MAIRLLRRFFIMCSMLPVLCACGGGGSSPATNSFVATPAPTPAPTASPSGTMALSQTVLAFSAPGQSATVTASEPGYSGPISASAGACGVVAAVSPSGAASSPAQFAVVSQASGSCAVTFTDAYGQTATLTVGVTITQGTIQ